MATRAQPQPQSNFQSKSQSKSQPQEVSSLIPRLPIEEIPWLKALRPHQVTAIEETLKAFAEGKQVVAVNAPTGSGKTIFAEMVRRGLEELSTKATGVTRCKVCNQLLTGYRSVRVGVGEDCAAHYGISHYQYWNTDPEILAANLAKKLSEEGKIAGVKGLYLCTTKQLQDQFLGDFSYAKLIKGRSNYPTLNFPERFGPPWYLSAADCNKRKVTVNNSEEKEEKEEKEENGLDENGLDEAENEDEDVMYSDSEYRCSLCNDPKQCPYEVAKEAALHSKLTVANLAYYLTEMNFGPRKFKIFPFVIIDEADELENALMSLVEVRIPPSVQEVTGIRPPERKTPARGDVSKARKPLWGAWFKEALALLERRMDDLKKGAPPAVDSSRASVEVRRERELKRLSQLADRIEEVGETIDQGGWVYTGEEVRGSRNPGSVNITFKPVKIDEMAKDYLWNHAGRFLIMSGTFLSKQQIMSDLGLQPHELAYIDVPSTFPAKNRPVYAIPRVSITRKSTDRDYETLVSAIDTIIDRYPNERGLIHTVSYKLTQTILDRSKNYDRMITYSEARMRTDALARFERLPNGVLVAPSFERGVDLKDELCRFCIIAKVPYPSLGDKQVSERLHTPGGNMWYRVQTIRSIIQMAGRGVRSETDWCHTYILDSQFLRIFNESKTLFPNWWKAAVVLRNKI